MYAVAAPGRLLGGRGVSMKNKQKNEEEATKSARKCPPYLVRATRTLGTHTGKNRLLVFIVASNGCHCLPTHPLLQGKKLALGLKFGGVALHIEPSLLSRVG